MSVRLRQENFSFKGSIFPDFCASWDFKFESLNPAAWTGPRLFNNMSGIYNINVNLNNPMLLLFYGIQ